MRLKNLGFNSGWTEKTKTNPDDHRAKLMPDAAFYFWADVSACPGNPQAGGDDTAFARELFAATHVTVLPGSYISREAHGVNPGRGFVRMALVSTVQDAIEAAHRIHGFVARRAGAAQPARRAV